MTGESISDDELMSLFEAAKWSPSHYNCQPWRFVYAKRGTQHWQKMFDLIWPLNQSWVKDAAVIGVIVSYKLFTFKGNKLKL